MKKIIVEGINGYFEINDKYIYVFLGEKNDIKYEDHIVWFDEIEDIVFKKPTYNKNGFISIYIMSKSIINNKKKYTLFLNRIDDKSMESYYLIYSFIREIISNKEVKIKEIIKEKESISEDDNNSLIDDKKEEKDMFITIDNNENKPKEQKIIVKAKDETIIEVKKKNKLEEKTLFIEKKEIDSIKKNIEKIVEEENKKDIINNEIIKIENESNTINEDNVVEVTKEDINEKLESYQDEEEEIEEEKETVVIETIETNDNKNDSIKSIDSLKSKINELEKELQVITYKEIIINKYIEDSMDRKKIDKLVIELKKIIEKLESIKATLKKHENTINANDFILIKNGNITITNIGDYLLKSNKNDLSDYLSTYKKIENRIDQIQDETHSLSVEADKKRKNLALSDKEYEKEINRFKGVESNKEFINKYINEAKKDLANVKWKIEKTIEPRVKYKYVRRGISSQTKMMFGISALNTLRPNKSRLSVVALSILSGTSLIGDLFGFDLKKVEYYEIIQKEILVGLDSIDTEKARVMIDYSKNKIDNILYECEKKYSNYPKFNELKKQLIGLKKYMEKEEKELAIIEDKIYDYKKSPQVKILKYKE